MLLLRSPECLASIDLCQSRFSNNSCWLLVCRVTCTQRPSKYHIVLKSPANCLRKNPFIDMIDNYIVPTLLFISYQVLYGNSSENNTHENTNNTNTNSKYRFPKQFVRTGNNPLAQRMKLNNTLNPNWFSFIFTFHRPSTWSLWECNCNER